MKMPKIKTTVSPNQELFDEYARRYDYMDFGTMDAFKNIMSAGEKWGLSLLQICATRKVLKAYFENSLLD